MADQRQVPWEPGNNSDNVIEEFNLIHLTQDIGSLEAITNLGNLEDLLNLNLEEGTN